MRALENPAGVAPGDPVYNVALGVDCGHCHVTGDWQSAAKPALRKVTLMNALFEEFPRYMPPTARTQCFKCHKGSVRPRAPEHASH